MARRTFVIGDIHGELGHLGLLLGKLPALDAEDTLVLLGDYLDRGPRSAEVVHRIRSLEHELPCRVVCLRGNHEDGWLRAIDHGWPGFLLPRSNGCLETVRSFDGREPPRDEELPGPLDIDRMERGAFFPPEVVAWMRSLPTWYEDEHAIYVHAGLPQEGDRWLHPSEVKDPKPLLWQRSRLFYQEYAGKRVVFGHTPVKRLPQEKSSYTPEDELDVYRTESLVGLDTGAGMGGFLSAIVLPEGLVLDSR